MSKAEPYNITQHRLAQGIAYDAVLHVQNKLYEGVTEKQAAAMIRDHLSENGITQYFHQPFAWFGDRTCFKGFQKPLVFDFKAGLPHFGTEFLPTDRALTKGMSVILDVACAVDGYVADIGYSFSFGRNDAVTKALHDLKPYRALVLRLAKKGATLSEIYHATEELVQKQGYRSCHAVYPLGVLGHRVGRLKTFPGSQLAFNRFPLATFLYYLQDKWGTKTSSFICEDGDDPLAPGLWAVEPHIGTDEFGVKFEELLLVTEDGQAKWLDASPPHVRFWKK